MDILVNSNNSNDVLGHSDHRVDTDVDPDVNVNVNVNVNEGVDPNVTRHIGGDECTRQLEQQQGIQQKQQQQQQIIREQLIQLQKLQQQSEEILKSSGLGGLFDGNGNILFDPVTLALTESVLTTNSATTTVSSTSTTMNTIGGVQQNIDAAVINSVHKNLDSDHGHQKERGVNSNNTNTNDYLSIAKRRNPNNIRLLLSEDIQQDSHNVTKKKKRKQRGPNNKSFPEQLWDVMMDNLNQEDAFEWLPDGKSFVVVDPDMFCNHVLDKTFKASKYGSFIRKLHRWGFIRLTSGIGTDCFHHPSFQRSRGELVKSIVSSTTKGGGKG